MPLRQKIGLVLLIGLSLLAMIMSIMRTVWIVASYSGASTLGAYNETSILTLALIEGDLVIIMGCIPTLRPLFKLDLSHFGSSVSKLFSFNKTKPSTAEKSHGKSDGYQDLEMSTQALGTVNPNERAEASVVAFSPNNGSQCPLVGEREVRRTDNFCITYESLEVPRSGKRILAR